MATLQSRHPSATFLGNARQAWLRKFESAVAFHAMEMAQQISDEIGKPIEEAYVSELLPVIAAIRWHRKRARAILKTRRMGGKPWWMMGRSVRVSRVPLGRVLIIATWNYPVGLLGIQLLQAIVAGNTVVVKPSERSPRSQALLLDIAQACGLPDGVLQVIGCSPQAGRDALEAGGFDHVIFTGGTSTGRAVAAHCAETLTSSTLELSGQDSAFVLADANMNKAAKSIWMACTMNAGQTCMAPRRVFVLRWMARARVGCGRLRLWIVQRAPPCLREIILVQCCPLCPLIILNRRLNCMAKARTIWRPVFSPATRAALSMTMN